MGVLGIRDGHNAAAVLVEDSKVVAGGQEEGLTRKKNQGQYPFRDEKAEDAVGRFMGKKKFLYHYVGNIELLVAETVARGDVVARGLKHQALGNWWVYKEQ